MDTAIVKQIDVLLSKHLKGFAKKEDLVKFATKEDLVKFATKEDLKGFATKKDLDNALKDFPTKKDLQDQIDEAIADIIHSVEVGKADKDSLREIEKKIQVIEDQINLSTQ